MHEGTDSQEPRLNLGGFFFFFSLFRQDGDKRIHVDSCYFLQVPQSFLVVYGQRELIDNG